MCFTVTYSVLHPHMQMRVECCLDGADVKEQEQMLSCFILPMKDGDEKEQKT